MPLGMQYRLMDKNKVLQRIADFDADCNYSVLLLILAESPHEELRAFVFGHTLLRCATSYTYAHAANQSFLYKIFEGHILIRPTQSAA